MGGSKGGVCGYGIQVTQKMFHKMIEYYKKKMKIPKGKGNEDDITDMWNILRYVRDSSGVKLGFVYDIGWLEEWDNSCTIFFFVQELSQSYCTKSSFAIDASEMMKNNEIQKKHKDAILLFKKITGLADRDEILKSQKKEKQQKKQDKKRKQFKEENRDSWTDFNWALYVYQGS